MPDLKKLLDWKVLVGMIVSALLGVGMVKMQEQGIDVKCPAAPSAVIEGSK